MNFMLKELFLFVFSRYYEKITHDVLDQLYKNDQTDKILIEIKKQVISKLSLLQAFKSVSLKATQSC